MRKNKIMLIVFLLLCFLCVTSCTKEPDQGSGSSSGDKTTYTITYELNGGICEILPLEYSSSESLVLPIPEKDYYAFMGWYDNPNFDGTKIEIIQKGTSGDKTYYAKFVPMFKHNSINFDGNGSKFVIKVLPLSEYAPFDDQYTYPDKAIKQAIQKSVETSYNIKIEYSEWENEAPFGIERINYIKRSFIDGSFLNKNIYAINIDTTFIMNLVKASCLAEIYNETTEEELITDYYNSLNNIENELLVKNKKLYGISNGYNADTFIIYNKTKVEQYGLTDPAELLYQGMWTWDTYDEWVKSASSKLLDDEKVISISPYDYIIGKRHSFGDSIINKVRYSLNNPKEIKNIFQEITAYQEQGIYDKQAILTSLSNDSINNKSLMASGSLYNLSYLFSNYENDVDCEIGIVPYPYNSEEKISFYYEPYDFTDGYGNKISVDKIIKDRNGETLKIADKEIYGINFTNSTYKTPVKSSSCFAVMNYNNAPISKQAAAHIMNDLLNTNSKLSEVEMILESLPINEFDKRILLSLQNQNLHNYEPLEVIDTYMMDNVNSHYVSWYSVCYNILNNEKNIDECVNIYKQQLG